MFADEIGYLRNNLHGDIKRFNMDSTQSHLIQLHALNKQQQPSPQQYNTEEIQRPAYRTRIPQPQHHTAHRRGRNHN